MRGAAYTGSPSHRAPSSPPPRPPLLSRPRPARRPLPDAYEGWVGEGVGRNGAWPMQPVYTGSRVCVRWPMPTVCALATKLRWLHAPSPRLPGSLRRVPWSRRRTRTSYCPSRRGSSAGQRWEGVHGQRRTGGHNPPSSGCVVARGTLRRPPHTAFSALHQGPDGEWRGATDLWVGMQSCASWVRATTHL